MTDYTDLQKAAEYAAQDTIKFADEAEETRALQQFHEEVDPETVLALIAERDQLKAENAAALREATDLALAIWRRRYATECPNFQPFEKAFSVIGQIDNMAAGLMCDQERLKAENEALRDDVEQSQYDANAWRNSEESVWIEVFHSEGDDPFISAISGQITVEQLALIQAEILEYRDDYFEKGSGLYVFKCRHCQAYHDNVGMTEPAHWETDFESYSPFPWEEEGAAMSKGEQS